MSASPVARQVTQATAIPRRVTITSASQLPSDYSTTPGGTMYSTTPGGTRIVYERNFLMQLRNSPLSRTPPKNMIPGLIGGNNNTSPSVSPSKLATSGSPPPITTGSSSSPPPPQLSNSSTTTAAAVSATPVDEQFQMEL